MDEFFLSYIRLLGFVTRPHMAGSHFFFQLGHRSLTTALLAARELFLNEAVVQAPCFTAVLLQKDISSITCKREPKIDGVLERVITNSAALR